MAATHQRLHEEQRLGGELGDPGLVAQARRGQPELGEPPAAAVDQGLRAELLGEAPQLTGRRGAFGEVDEVHLDAALGEEPQGGARVGALPGAEDLHFHRSGPRPRHQAIP